MKSVECLRFATVTPLLQKIFGQNAEPYVIWQTSCSCPPFLVAPASLARVLEAHLTEVDLLAQHKALRQQHRLELDAGLT